MISREETQGLAPGLLYQYDAPVYLYQKNKIEEQISLLRETFSGAELLFSIKANPFPPLLSYLSDRGLWMDAASPGEVLLALEAGASQEHIYYSSCGKTAGDISGALGKCRIVADSMGELERLEKIAAAEGAVLGAGIRVNPDFSMDGGNGLSSKFGIDEELLMASAGFLSGLRHIRVEGLHVHLCSQVLDTVQLVRYYERIYDLALRLSREIAPALEFINFGGGVGVAYNREEEGRLDLKKVRDGFLSMAKRNEKELQAKLLIESGRFLACGAGVYVTEIVDIKVSRGLKYLVAKGGLNGFLRPAVRELLRTRGKENPASAEPVFTEMDCCSVRLFSREGEKTGAPEPVCIVGNLCTAVDVMASDVLLPAAEIGDRLVFSNAGSYGRTLSPLLFSSHEAPGQFLVQGLEL